MSNMEQLELSKHRHQIAADVKQLIEKYRSIFEWDIPEVDQKLSDSLILQEVKKVIEEIENDLGF